MLNDEQRQEVEERVADCCRDGRFDAAATITIESYGPEILGYLMALCRDAAEADEAFAVFSEDLWRGIAQFRLDASMRTWAYALARHALSRQQRDRHQRAGQRVPLSQSPEARRVVAELRATTLPHLRTDVKDQVAKLREELEPEDQTLFILRIGRKMSWRDIAVVMSEQLDAPADELERDAARLRKRFARAKATLAEKVRERGIR